MIPRAARRVMLGLGTGLGIVIGLGVAVGLGRGGAGPEVPQHRAIPAIAHFPGEEVRVVVLGTSLTQGGSWPEELGAVLSRCSVRPVTILRVARAGAHSGWGRDQADIVAALRPNLVLIEFTINDADLGDGQRLDRAQDNHLALFAALGTAWPQTRLVLMTMSPAFGLRGLMRPWLESHQAQYRSLAASEGLGLIDLAPLWARALSSDRRLVLMPDGLHPTDAAVREVALPEIVAQIAPAIPGCG